MSGTDPSKLPNSMYRYLKLVKLAMLLGNGAGSKSLGARDNAAAYIYTYIWGRGEEERGVGREACIIHTLAVTTTTHRVKHNTTTLTQTGKFPNFGWDGSRELIFPDNQCIKTHWKYRWYLSRQTILVQMDNGCMVDCIDAEFCVR